MRRLLAISAAVASGAGAGAQPPAFFPRYSATKPNNTRALGGLPSLLGSTEHYLAFEADHSYGWALFVFILAPAG